jgi:tRNA threonylcarbamoyladenosine biosynthesis protein TsaB
MTKILLIDTSSNIEIKVGIEVGGEKYFIKRRIGVNKAQAVLPLIDILFKKRNLKISDIGKIRVNVRHGSFTGVRVGLTVANALSFVLKVPVEKIQFD